MVPLEGGGGGGGLKSFFSVFTDAADKFWNLSGIFQNLATKFSERHN